MKEQIYIINEVKSFEPKQIFECGQCFRWNENEDGSYTGIVKNNILNVKKENKKVVIKSFGKDDLEKLSIDYFDLETDYEKIKGEYKIWEWNKDIKSRYLGDVN